MPIDYKKYPPNWKTEIRPRILKRANNCCEFCGLPNHSTVYSIKIWVRDVTRYKQRSIWFRNEQDAKREGDHYFPVKVVLTIAHLDHDELNHNVTDERLAALCQACHCRYDAKEKYQRQFRK